MAIKNKVTQEFGIPREHHLRPIDGKLLETIGHFTSDVRAMTPAELALSLVFLEGYSSGGQTNWALFARSAQAGDEAEPIFGSVQINDDEGARITPDEALLAGDAWIRSSQTTEFVPGSVAALPVPEDMRGSGVAGLLLVRAAEVQQQTN